MLDIKIIRENPDLVRKSLRNRGVSMDIEEIRALDERHRALLAEIEGMRSERNAVSGKIGELMRDIGQARKSGDERPELEKEVEALRLSTSNLGDDISERENGLTPMREELHQLLLQIPNVADESVPIGADESENVEVRRWGTAPEFDFEPLPHWEIGQNLGILDFERATKIAQARFVLYLGAGAALERSLINFMLDLHTRKHGYTEAFPPILVNEDSLTATGQLPKMAEDMFRCRDDDLYLIPTAEVPVTNIHRDEVLDAEELPVKYAAFTPCFRREAGAHGRDTRGIIRQHQFNKVELVKFVLPETSYDEHEALTRDAARVLELLGLHYRVLALCTGDLSFAAAKCYDLEVWMPGFGDFREISSCSNFEDFQARRGNIRYRPEKGAKPRFVHTINGSGLAIGRTVAAVLENYQQADGSVTVPEVLRPYMGRDIISK